MLEQYQQQQQQQQNVSLARETAINPNLVDEDEKLKEDVLQRVLYDTDGFSGRAIAKMAIAWQAAVYGTDGAVLDKDTFFSTVLNHKEGMKQKEEWSQQSVVT